MLLVVTLSQANDRLPMHRQLHSYGNLSDKEGCGGGVAAPTSRKAFAFVLMALS